MNLGDTVYSDHDTSTDFARGASTGWSIRMTDFVEENGEYQTLV